MSDQEEWGPWVEHDQSGCPVVDGTCVIIGIECPDESYETGPLVIGLDYLSENWTKNDLLSRILFNGRFGIKRYRIRKPRALTELKALVADLPDATPAQPARIREPEPA